MGDAHRDGRRPDVAEAFPTAHDLFKGAWPFTLDLAAVRTVRRPVQLQFFADDGSCQRAEIGRRTVR
jgi:hypothetical protein